VTLIVDREASSPGEITASRQFVDLDLENWEGKLLSETPLHPWLSDALRIDNGLIVIWSPICHLCAEHLMRLSTQERGTRDIVLLRLPKELDQEQLDGETVLPVGGWVQEAQLSSKIVWLVTPPAHVEVKNGRVVVAKEGTDVLK
ncbi:MAG: hypothetical protein KAI66_28150, partial [Lentisphaeria bacterium]|nr:hypothetical protein [Lentisphaeria bacterium]